ncbi:kinesin-like protein KIF3B [Daphnia magna]|uniref:kinesin-like protein KIF3B n=1 Tax=Daphnia magna TaxID=35525 RepID=UPI001E1BB3ED|nr:kinesin-like protein KIF3B [Daphnia magna]
MSAETVKVIVRCRPMNEKETSENYEGIVNVLPKCGAIEILTPTKPQTSREFTFDCVYDSTSNQKALYDESFKPLVDSVLQGYNGTIFAYGQTGTGKTYTMEGVAKDPDKQGVIPRSFEHIFNHIAQSHDRQYLVRASYLEIYKEQIRDLVSKDPKKRLELKENSDTGVFVKDLSSFVCKSVVEIEHVMNVGNVNRSTGATNMNEHSSRSHAIFMITVESCDVGQSEENHIVVGKLNLVDLAGSERQTKTGASGDRLKEASKINLSLSALGNVISALVDGKNGHVPYRDSKLTRLLQDSLGGNSRTVMVANIGPASYNYEETLTTLRYASRAKHIRNKPQINEDPKDALLRSFQQEIARLKASLINKKTKPKKKGEGGLHDVLKSSDEWGDDTEAELEQERKDILNNSSLIAEERDQLLKTLQNKQEELRNKRENQEQLASRIEALESKLLTGHIGVTSENGTIEDVTKKQQQTLEAHRQEIIERERQEREIRQKLESQDEEVIDFKENFSSLQQEIDYKTRKLRKMYARWQSVRQEMSDLGDEFNRQRRELEETQEVLMKELRLKQLIVSHFVPPEFRRQITSRLRYEEDDEKWMLSSATEMPLLPRSCASKFELRPTSDFEKLARSTEDSSSFGRFKCENIFMLSLDIPQRTTKEYEGPEISPTLQAALTQALQCQSHAMEVQSSKYKPVDIHSFLKSACRRKMQLIQRPRSRNSAKFNNSPSHKRYPQGHAPDGTITAAPYPKSRGLVPK